MEIQILTEVSHCICTKCTMIQTQSLNKSKLYLQPMELIHNVHTFQG